MRPIWLRLILANAGSLAILMGTQEKLANGRSTFSVRGESPEMTEFLSEIEICIIPQIIGMEERPLPDSIGSEILLSVTSCLTPYLKVARKNS